MPSPSSNRTLLSVVVPCFNEAANIQPFYKQLRQAFSELHKAAIDCELIYVNDGSTDDTLSELQLLAKAHSHIKVIDLSRNFGKEIATTAGLHYATGDAIIMIDGDGQHPPELIPEFVQVWKQGVRIVTGVRLSNQREGWVKRYGSRVFYTLFNRFADVNLVPGASDFRLIDKSVQAEFNKMTERNRVTRGLIDWLGFEQAYIKYHANARMSGNAGYSFGKLLSLATNSSISLSLKPLYFSAWAGAIVLPFSVLLGLFSAIEMLVGDPLDLNITGGGFVIIFILFLIGLLLVSQGIMALYISHMHSETQNRPLYVVNEVNSRGL